MELIYTSPEKIGLKSKHIINFLEDLKAYGIEMHGMMLLRHGKVFFENYYAPYSRDTRHIMFSFTKSLTSTAVGFAVQEGLLDLDEKLVDIFPENLPEEPSENLKKATVWHLLTMSCGHATEIPNYGMGNKDWIKAFLSHEFTYEPGTTYMYNTAGTNLVSEIIYKKTGETLFTYLKSRLFDPLGIDDYECYKLPDGVDMGGSGSKLTVDGMARFIQFVADKGVTMDGKRLLNEEWFERATSRLVETISPCYVCDKNSDWAQGYGFQFWQNKYENSFRADGAFGQYGVVCRDEDFVFVCTSAATNMDKVLISLWENIAKNFQDVELGENQSDTAVLEYIKKTSSVPSFLSSRNFTAQEKYMKKTYICDSENTLCWEELIGGAGVSGTYSMFGIAPVNETDKMQEISFRNKGFECEVITKLTTKTQSLKISMNSSFNKFHLGDTVYGAVGRWIAPNKFEFETRCTKAATGTRFVMEFTETCMKLTPTPSFPDRGGLADGEKAEVHFVVKL